jgi:hypothetical protein
MARKRSTYGQGSIYQRKGWWWCSYSIDGVRRRESCETQDRDAALGYLQRKQGKLASGELLTADRVRVRDLLALVLEDYDLRGVAQAYISSLKVKSILNPKLGDIRAAKLSTSQVQQYIRDRLKTVKPGTVNREMALLHRAYQLGFQHDPPLVGRVPHFPKLPEGDPRKGFLKPELYRKLLLELPEELRLLFVIAYHVGLRRGALLRLSGRRSIRKAPVSGCRVNGRIESRSLWRCRSTATWPNSWPYSGRKAISFSPEVPARSRISGRAGSKPVSALAFRTCSSTIYEGRPFEISVGRV